MAMGPAGSNRDGAEVEEQHALGQKYGQHFLTSRSTLERIADAAATVDSPAELIVEIGPGRGALTEHLLRRARRVVAIEIDTVLVHYLRNRFREQPSLTVIHGDILKADLSSYGPAVVAGNLPYYITSPILERVFAMGEAWRRAVFLVQKEVAERVAAAPGSRDYGFLSVQARLYSEPKLLFTVAPGAFRPPPKVESAVFSLTPRKPLVEDAEGFLHFASMCFRQKRKTLRNNLLVRYEKSVLDALPQGAKRAEQLTLEELAGLWRVLGPASGSRAGDAAGI